MISTDSRLRAIEKEWKKNPLKRKSFAKSPRISKQSVNELIELDKEISAKGKIKNSLFLHDKKTREKLNNIGWRIRNG